MYFNICGPSLIRNLENAPPARPTRLNRGTGGVVAQMERVFDSIRPGEYNGSEKIAKQRTTAHISESEPINAMAPTEKQKRKRKAKVCLRLT